jgi:CheY-like chemotaxis protein
VDRAFIATIKASTVSPQILNPQEDNSPKPRLSDKKSKILIFEPDYYLRIGLEQVFCNRLKLRAQTHFYSSGSDILAKIKELYEQADENQVAICIIDYRMPVMNATRLITETLQFMQENRVAVEDRPRFAFRADKFWELTPE